MVVVDPGPDVDHHVRALASRVAAADEVVIVLTHGHPDHAGAARALSSATGAPVWGPQGVADVDHVLRDGDVVETDDGRLVAVHTPGHTPEHLCFHWASRRALFAGDLVLGEGDTTWVAEYPGCVSDYLASLERVRGLGLDVIYPAHGPARLDPLETLDRYEGHRRRRIAQVEAAMTAHPGADPETLLDVVYGDTILPEMRGAARRSLEALIDFVNGVESGAP